MRVCTIHGGNSSKEITINTDLRYFIPQQHSTHQLRIITAINTELELVKFTHNKYSIGTHQVQNKQ